MSQVEEIRKRAAKEQANIKPRKTKFFGADVWIWVLSSYEMEAWRAFETSDDPVQKNKSTAKLVQISVRDEDGNYVYPADSVDMIAGYRPASELDRIARESLELNGYGAAGAEQILKNLLGTPGGSSVPGSQENTDAASPNCTTDTPATSSPSST